jgi:hypothetical protein
MALLKESVTIAEKKVTGKKIVGLKEVPKKVNSLNGGKLLKRKIA